MNIYLLLFVISFHFFSRSSRALLALAQRYKKIHRRYLYVHIPVCLLCVTGGRIGLSLSTIDFNRRLSLMFYDLNLEFDMRLEEVRFQNVSRQE
jgi:hypothetical protein